MESALPLWLKLGCMIYVSVLVPVYLRRYGAANFLWFSDIALFGTVAALWLESSLIASTMAVAIVLLELVWTVDFLARLVSGVKLMGLSHYMFDTKISIPIRALSLFHLILPPLLVWMVWRLEYDERAFAVQTVLAWIVLSLSRVISTPKENINWVYGLGSTRQHYGLLYFIALMIGFPLIVYLPTHLILKALFN